MIVDVHQHFVSLPADMEQSAVDLWAQRTAETFSLAHGRGARSEGADVPVEEVKQRLLAWAPDPDGRKLIGRMDEAGIDVTVMCVVDNVARGSSDEAVMALNQRCAEVARQSGGRLVALAGIDPRRKEAPALFRHCIEEFGMKGLKWHPDFGFYPNGEEAYAVLRVAEELGVPLLTHTGPLSPVISAGLPPSLSARAKYAHPALLDDVALDFPGLKIIAAHMGMHQAWREWAALAQVRPNLYGDLAIWQFYALANYERFARELREILDIAGPDSVLFGSDDPYLNALVPNDRFIQLIRDLPEKAPAGVKFSQAEVAAILGENARKVFGL